LHLHLLHVAAFCGLAKVNVAAVAGGTCCGLLRLPLLQLQLQQQQHHLRVN